MEEGVESRRCVAVYHAEEWEHKCGDADECALVDVEVIERICNHDKNCKEDLDASSNQQTEKKGILRSSEYVTLQLLPHGLSPKRCSRVTLVNSTISDTADAPS